MSLTLPNLISFLRLGLVPLFIIAVVDGRPLEALVIVVIAGVSDALDGLIARFWGQQSTLGAYLDPLADKCLLVSAYATLALPGLRPGVVIPVWVSVLVIARDVLILLVCAALYLALYRRRFPPTFVSKVNTTMQIVAVVLVLLSGLFAGLEEVTLAALYLVALTTVMSGLSFLPAVARMNDGADGGDERGAPE